VGGVFRCLTRSLLRKFALRFLPLRTLDSARH
jgi:hypothetical protein